MPEIERGGERTEFEGEGNERRGAEGMIFDIARKAVVGSVRSILSSEDGIKALIGAIVPKEVGQTVLREVANLRTETVRAVVAEIGRFLERLDPAVEIQKILSGLRFDVHVSVEISPRESASRGSTAPVAAPPVQERNEKGRKSPRHGGRDRGRAS